MCWLLVINDLEYGVENWILKFADDTKIFSKILTDVDTVRLQQDLDKLLDWVEEWQMMFHASTRKVMQFGIRNAVTTHIGAYYRMAKPWLQLLKKRILDHFRHEDISNSVSKLIQKPVEY